MEKSDVPLLLGSVPIVPIDVRVTVFNVSSIDTPAQQFTCDVYAVCIVHKDHFTALERLKETFDPKVQAPSHALQA
jgi:hypothetical protein